MKVLQAENWEEKFKNCVKKNKENKRNLLILKSLLTISICGFFLACTFYSLKVLDNRTLVILFTVFNVYVFFMIWALLGNVIGYFFDEIVGGEPIFTPVVDNGATLSYLLKKGNAKVVYSNENGKFYVEYGKKQIELSDIKLIECDIEKPILDLKEMTLKLPLNWILKEKKASYEVVSNASSEMSKELSKIKLK